MDRLLQIRDYIRRHWLESVLVLILAAVLSGYAALAIDFLPKPQPVTPTAVAGLVKMPVVTATAALAPTATPTRVRRDFDGDRAYEHVLEQTKIGPRATGTDGHRRTIEYITGRLRSAGWQVDTQQFTYKGTSATNIIAKAGQGPVMIVGAHYDTRRQADQETDPNKRREPVMGANDGASGVAVLLELAQSLNRQRLTNEVWLTFFDAEDNGGLDGWDFIAGSRYLAEKLTIQPKGVIVVDMIGDSDQQLYRERNSNRDLQDRVWSIANQLGYSKWFIPQYKHSMIDDHTPFLEKGIPALDIIDFDYQYWHTTQDTADKVSPDSLERVGRVLKVLLES